MNLLLGTEDSYDEFYRFESTPTLFGGEVERVAKASTATIGRYFNNLCFAAGNPTGAPIALQWTKPQTIFVNSMSNLFHDDVPVSYIRQVFDVMRRASWHRFQVLTKTVGTSCKPELTARMGTLP